MTSDEELTLQVERRLAGYLRNSSVAIMRRTFTTEFGVVLVRGQEGIVMRDDERGVRVNFRGRLGVIALSRNLLRTRDEDE